MFLLQKATAPSWIEDNQGKLWLWTQPWTFSLKTAHTQPAVQLLITHTKFVRWRPTPLQKWQQKLWLIFSYSWSRFSEISLFLWSFTRTSGYEGPSTTLFSTWLYPTSSTLWPSWLWRSLRLFQARNPGKSTVRGCWETFYATLLNFS